MRWWSIPQQCHTLQLITFLKMFISVVISVKPISTTGTMKSAKTSKITNMTTTIIGFPRKIGMWWILIQYWTWFRENLLCVKGTKNYVEVNNSHATYHGKYPKNLGKRMNYLRTFLHISHFIVIWRNFFDDINDFRQVSFSRSTIKRNEKIFGFLHD